MVTKTPLRSTKIQYSTPAPGPAPSEPEGIIRKIRRWSSRSASALSTFMPFSGKSYFEGASNSPRLIQVADVGPNSHNLEIAKLRAKSRWMFSNDPFFKQSCRQVANNSIHYGIKPNIKDRVLRKLWRKLEKEIDTRGQADLHGLAYMAAVVMARDGECFFRIRARRPGEMKSGINFQIQSLEAEHVPLEETRILPNGNIVVSGVERDQLDRIVAYWVLDYHPNDYKLTGLETSMPKRVLAKDMMHVVMHDRFSATRGTPWGAPALTTVERCRTYEDAELERKIMASSRGGLYKKPRLSGEDDSMFGDDDSEFIAVAPGEYAQVPVGWDFQEFTPAATDSNYGAYRRETLSGLAVAFGFAVELITMNWEKLASDRQYRALVLELIRFIESVQHHVFVFRFYQVIWERFVSEAFMNGLWKPEDGKSIEDYFDVEWITPKRGYIHPVQDVNAISAAIKNGLESRKRAVAGNGEDVEDIDAENAEDVARATQFGLRYEMLGMATQEPGGLLGLVDQYGIAVRAGLITPQLDDEEFLRAQAGLPPLSDAAKAAWEEAHGVKRPITLAPAATPPLDPTFVTNPETGEVTQQTAAMEPIQ